MQEALVVERFVNRPAPQIVEKCSKFEHINVLLMPPFVGLYGFPQPAKGRVWDLLPAAVDQSLR